MSDVANTPNLRDYLTDATVSPEMRVTATLEILYQVEAMLRTVLLGQTAMKNIIEKALPGTDLHKDICALMRTTQSAEVYLEHECRQLAPYSLPMEPVAQPTEEQTNAESATIH